MSAHKCSYFQCENSRRKNTSLRMFGFPVQDQQRCKEWIINSGNSSLAQLSPESLKKKHLCSDHFAEKYLQSTKLPKNAVPLKYDEDEFFEEFCPRLMQKVYPPSKKKRLDLSIRQDFESIPSTSAFSPDVMSQEDLEWVQNLITLPIQEKCGTRKENKKRKIKATLSTTFHQTRLNMLPPFSKSLTRMQLYHKARTPWLSDEKKMAISLYYKGPRSYKFLRRKGVVLPSISVIKN